MAYADATHSVSAREAGRLPARAWRLLAFAATVLMCGFALLRIYATSVGAFAGMNGIDIDHYLSATRRWMETGTPYLASEVAGKFSFGPDTFLHPPIALPLFAPFLVLPPVLWWAIPLAIVGGVVASLRPKWWAWPLLAAMLCWPTFAPSLVVGNTDLWVWAFVALGIRYGWPAALICVKPSLGFLMLLGVTRRSWWVACLAIGMACVPFGSLWIEWIKVVLNSPGSLAYSFQSVPWLLLPVVAWAVRAYTGSPSVMTNVPGSVSDSTTSNDADPVSPVAETRSRVKVPGAIRRT